MFSIRKAFLSPFSIMKLTIPYFFFFLVSLCIRCDQNPKSEAHIASIPVAIKIDRFDKQFSQGKPEDIPILKARYPYLFPAQYADSVWVKRQSDSMQLMLQDEVNKKFPTVEPIEQDLNRLFQRIKFYFPETKIPHTIAISNGVDYQLKVIYADSLLFLSLDTFLGSNHPFYEGIPEYIRQDMTMARMPSEVVSKFSERKISPPENRTLLAQMIYHGKKIYLQNIMLSHLEESLRFGFTAESLNWAKDNERYIWQYFVERELLFSTDSTLLERFIDPAPFSKFYLDIDNESPGGIGRWLGYQIVKSYVKMKPEVPLDQVLKLPSQHIFKMSKYKPKR